MAHLLALQLPENLPVPVKVRQELQKLVPATSADLARLWATTQTVEPSHSAGVKATRHASARIDCSVFAPPWARLDQAIIAQVFLHDQNDLQRAAQLATAADATAERNGFATLRTKVGKGSRIDLRMESADFVVYNPVPKVALDGRASVQGSVYVSVDAVPVGEIAFEILLVLGASTVAADSSEALARYLEEIRQFPMLEPAQEYMMAKRWQEHQDSDAAHKLVTSHLRLVTRIAMGYRGYGLPIGDVISEGNAGLMQAVKRFRALCDTLFLCGIVRNIDERACSCRKVQFHPGALEHEPRMNVRFQRRALVGVLAPTGPG